MEPLLQQLRTLPERFGKLGAGTRALLLGGGAVLLVGALVTALLLSRGGDWQYAFTGLAKEDGQEAEAVLRSAGIPFRVEGEGTAVAVPAGRVYDARLVLAAAGLPRREGAGFELFDKSDIGVSQFTQNVNLQRALEGELARTIRGLDVVDEARVHLTLPRKGLYEDEDQPAASSVVVRLRAGERLGTRQLAGIRHLVASAVPGLEPSAVTVVDGSGTVLASDDLAGGGELGERQRRMEQRLERRIVGLLEPVVGPGAVLARVTVDLDATEVKTTAQVFDPDASAVRSERSVVQTQSRGAPAVGGVAGAAANTPVGPAPAAGGTARGGASSSEDDVRNYEISNTVTQKLTRAPRVGRLTVAVIVDGVDGQPRPAAEVSHLKALVQRAVGFEAARGDDVEVTSLPFAHLAKPEPAAPPAPPALLDRFGLPQLAAAGLGLLVLLALAVALLRRRRRLPAPGEPVLVPGARVGDLEAALEGQSPEAALAAAAPPGPEELLRTKRERARALIQEDPTRAVRLLRAWISEPEEVEATDA